MLDGPLSGNLLELYGVVHQHAGDLCILRVFGLRGTEEGLEGEKGGFDSEHGRPG